MARSKSTIKQGNKRQRLTLRKRGGSRAEIKNLFPEGGYANFNWNFYYITAHGSLSQNMFKIPANTYILNIATTGKSCTAWNSDIEGIFFADGDTQQALENRKKEIYDRVVSGLLTSRSSEGREHLYTGRDIRRNIEELYNSTDAAGGRTIAYYEPGDYMFDTEIYFRNHSFPVFTMGVYLLPMKESLKKAIINVNQPVWTNGKRPSTNMLLTEDFQGRLNVDDNTLNQMLDKADMIFDVPENLARDVMFSSSGLLKLPGTYNTLVYKGKKPENINLKYYNEEKIKKLENYLFPAGETNEEQQSQYLERLSRVTPPDVNRALLKRYNQAPFIRAGRKIPTLFDYVNHLNSIDSRPKLIIVDLCRSIDSLLRKADFTKQIVRRMSLATRQRNIPIQPSATTSTSATTATTAATTKLRSQLQEQFMKRVKDAIDRSILRTDITQEKKQNLTNVSRLLETFLKKQIFDFRELRNILRTIKKQELIQLQQPLVDLLELDSDLPTSTQEYLPYSRSTPYYARVDDFFKNKKEKELKMLKAQAEAAAALATAQASAKTALKKIKLLKNPTSDQENAIKDFMSQMWNSPYGRGIGISSPDEMEKVYWSWVESYLIDPKEPILPRVDLNLEDLLKKFNHKELIAAGIDITAEGMITI